MSTRVIQSLSCLALLAASFSCLAVHHPTTHHKTKSSSSGIDRPVKKFDEVNIGGDSQLNITVGAAQKVTLLTSSAQAKCILTDVNGNTLYIHHLSSSACHSATPLNIAISVPNLVGIMSHGNNSTTINHLKTKTFLSYSSGSSHMTLQGTTTSLNSVLSGESSVNAENLTTQSALVSASGNSQMQLHATTNLFIKASGNSSITYSGKPKKLVKSLSGTSSVSQSG